MDKSSSHKTNGTPSTTVVKLKTASDSRGKLRLEITFKDMMVPAIEKAAKEKNLTVNQYVTEVLERTLIRSGHLPEWWLTRQF